ncbi:MAG: hypothetical protein M0Z76_04355 [Gammaproteobacteria bacterium]|nr:hypothetical protein [Gammaproteobacteria bacterium]
MCALRRWFGLLGVIVPLGAQAVTHGPARHMVTHIAPASVLGQSPTPLADILNPARLVQAPVGMGARSGIAGSLVLKPDLGSCKTFARACAEGGIISPVPLHPIRTLGAGVGLQLGGVRLEYARGLQTGTNFIGIRSRLP